jgi:hypothetical protein
MFNKNKKAALELSVGTIVIIVLAVSMLILGIVLVRSIMCAAIGLTGQVNEKVKGELNRLFSDQGGEVQCVGAGGEPVKIIPAETNIIYCTIKAPERAEYSFTVSNIDSDSATLTSDEMQGWLVGSPFSGSIPPGDDEPKKVVRIRVPDNAPEALIFFDLDVSRDGELVSTKTLDFEISRVGFVRNTLC